MLNTERLCVGCMNDNGGEKICSICGYDSGIQNAEEYLPTRYWLKDRYLIGRVTESNGEGVTYIGWDNKEDQIVNIREYYPSDAARRNTDKTVKIMEGNAFVFNEGIMNFLELHRKLATLTELPSLLPVVEVFEDNGTAYSITKSVSGITLREFLIRNGGNLNWEQARPLFLPLITTVQGLHAAGILHRGISPETVIVGRDGKLRLTGICVRDVRMSKSSLSVQLFPGFSATEQYGFDLELKDGKYTDVYGVAATLFRVLMGAAPTDASERISNDNLQIPARFVESLPKYVLSALANGLQIMPKNRITDMEAFRIALTPITSDSTIAFTAPAKKAEPKPAPANAKKAETAVKEKNNSARKYAIISSAVTAAVFIVLAIIFFIVTKEPEKNNGNNNTQTGNNNPSQSVEQPSKEDDNPSIVPPPDAEASITVPNFVYDASKPIDEQMYGAITNNVQFKQEWEFTFEIEDEEYSDTVPIGCVISQTPEAGQTVKKGAVIKLVLSQGPSKIEVPNVIGKTKDEAIQILERAGFVDIAEDDRYKANIKPNVVYAVTPNEGTKIDRYTKITILYHTEEETPTDNSTTGDTTDGNTQKTQ